MKSSSQAQSSSESASSGRDGPSGSDSSDPDGRSSDGPPGGPSGGPKEHAFGKGAHSEKSSSKKGPRPLEDSDSADLQKVRELLFGAQAKQHERDLHAQAERVELLEARLSDRLSALEREFAAQVRNIEASLRDELQSEVAAIVARLDEQGSSKVERSDLRSMLSDLANRMGE